MPRHTARGIVLHDDRLLLIERWRGGLHYYSIPGGGIEAGETPIQAVGREITEETGCLVDIGRELYRLQLPDGTKHHIFLCEFVSGEPHLPADSPEALAGDPSNRFEPCWLAVSDLLAAPFLVWQPVKERLLQDMAAGFPERLVTLTPDVIP